MLVVMDHDKKTFSVEGPMQDDRPWDEAVVAAQQAGRDVRCHTPGDNLNRDSAADRIHGEFPDFIVVASRSIVSPRLV